MKRLWAPWRIKYIKNYLKEKTCFLCKALREKNKDEKNLILYRGLTCFSILNKFPYNNGHLMIAPYKHTGKLENLSDDEMLEMMKLVVKMKKVIKETMYPDGFNIGINIGRCAGAGLLTHIHIHIVPRWNGDTSFMPVLSNNKVIPQFLDNTYKELKSFLGENFNHL